MREGDVLILDGNEGRIYAGAAQIEYPAQLVACNCITRPAMFNRGQTHQTETWRDADRHLKRVTDGRLETHVFKPANQDEWRMMVLDRARKIRTDIDRTNLLRIGHFSDWFSLSHALARPVGPYQLVALATAPDMPKPVARCRWYELTRDEVASHLCWSTILRLPLVITDASNLVQWQVTAVDTRTQPGSTFDIDDAGFVHINANEEIQSD